MYTLLITFITICLYLNYKTYKAFKYLKHNFKGYDSKEDTIVVKIQDGMEHLCKDDSALYACLTLFYIFECVFILISISILSINYLP